MDKAARAALLTAAGILDKARARTAVTRAGGQIAPSKYLPNVPRAVHAGGGSVDFVKDNPGGDWLAKKQSYAFEYPRMKGIDGAITGWMGGKSDLFLPTHVLKSIEPLNNEKRVAGEPRFDDLMSSVSKEGFDPHQKGNKVVVAVNHHGKPFILEGNTRVAVAHAMGVPSVKAEVRYWNGAEEADGPMHPDKVSAMASSDPDITKADGGDVEGDNGHIYVVHGGSDFDQIDKSYSGRGEPGNIRPLGNGLYGYVLDHTNPENVKNAIGWATRYSQKYGGGKKALHVFKVPKSSSTVFNGYRELNVEGYPKPIKGLGLEPTEELNAYEAHEATEPPYDEKNSADYWAHERKRRALWDAVQNAADLRMQHLPIGLTEVAIQNPKVATRIGKFSLDTPTSDILDAVKSDVQSRATGGRIHAEDGGKMELRSKAAEVISGLKGEKGLAEDMIRAAKNAGVKDVEIANANPPSGKISRDELARHFENAVPKVQVKRIGDAEKVAELKKQHSVQRDIEGMTDDEIDSMLDHALGVHEPLYEQYQLPYGKNYREHILSLPDDRGEKSFHSTHWDSPNVLAHVRLSDRYKGETQKNIEPIIGKLAQYFETSLDYLGPSSADHAVKKGVISPNEAATVSRFMRWKNGYETQKGVGRKILHVEELQSDWNNTARKQGLKTGREKQEYDDYVAGMRQKMIDKVTRPQAPVFDPETGEDRLPIPQDVIDKKVEKYQKMHPSDLAATLGVSAEHRQMDLARYKGVYPAPYIDPDSRDVENLALKHVLTEAAKGGYDGITFTPGSEQSARWGNTDFGDIYDRILPNMTTKLARQHDKTITPDVMGLPGARGNTVSAQLIPLTETARQSILKNGFGAFKRGGTVGKEEGGSVTDSDEFRNWFGNSMTHTNGEPHVFYHGTSKDKDFTSFNVGRHGAWFTRDPALASQYAEQNDSQGYKQDGWKLTPINTASRVIPAYVKAENPYTGDLPDEVLRGNYKKAQSDWFDTLRRKGHDAWIPARHNGDLVVALKEPQQIKSIFNNGKFDPKQKHMNKAEGGTVDDTETQATTGSLGNGPQAGGLPDAGGVRGSESVLPAPLSPHGEVDLQGLPKDILIPKLGIKVTAGHNPEIRQVARDYTKQAGIDYSPPTLYKKVDPNLGKRISDAYADMAHFPQHPLVNAAYEAMKRETLDQYRMIQKAGVKMEFYPDVKKDPYHSQPRLMTEDVNNNKHMYVYPTVIGGFGTGKQPKGHENNPLLGDSGERWNGQPVVFNDLFRAVHDYFGHVKEGLGFRGDGEENAWRSHAAMYSPLARIALGAETRGQNSLLNYGPNGEHNRTASPEDTIYSPQKLGVMPIWALHEGAEFIKPEERAQMEAIYRHFGLGPEGFVEPKVQRAPSTFVGQQKMAPTAGMPPSGMFTSKPTLSKGGTVGKEEGGATGSLREKGLWTSAQAIKAGTGSREAHAALVNKIKPVLPYAAPVPPASDQQVHDALTKDKQPKAFAPRRLGEGTPVAVRLDIPAYEKRNTWVVSVHHPKSDFTAGEVIGYDSVAHIDNPRFGVHPTGALNIASGKPKATIATAHGNWKKTTPEDAFKLSQTVHNDPQWRQVGMDPERHSYFYDRETQEPVMAADEALHIGPLVYAKNPVYGKKTDFAFSNGGEVDDNQPNNVVDLGFKRAVKNVMSDEPPQPVQDLMNHVANRFEASRQAYLEAKADGAFEAMPFGDKYRYKPNPNSTPMEVVGHRMLHVNRWGEKDPPKLVYQDHFPVVDMEPVGQPAYTRPYPVELLADKSRFEFISGKPKLVKRKGGAVGDALSLTRRFTKDGTGATMALKPKGK